MLTTYTKMKKRRDSCLWFLSITQTVTGSPVSMVLGFDTEEERAIACKALDLAFECGEKDD